MIRLRDIPAPTKRALDRFLAGSSARKIFAIGFNKTGTTSLHRIFKNLGYRSLHDDRWLKMSDPLLFKFYDAFSDGFPENIRALDALFPEARFILQVRDLDAWLDSRIEHIRRLPADRNRPPGWNYDEYTVESWVKQWNAYHVDTIEYFRDRPEKLLLVNYIRDPEAAAKIAAFLGHLIPIEKAFANRNPGAGGKLKNAEMLARILTRLGIPETEWKNDIHCPSYTHVDVALIPAVCD